MSTIPRSSFIKAMKSKVIIALLLACFALFMAWGVSKVAFKEMLTTVESISAPSERLRMVNVISRKIGSLDQLQKRQALNDPGNYRKLFKESGQLRDVLDSLAALYTNDSVQLLRIYAIKKLLSERDGQFINYLKVRERLINNKSFSDQVQNLSNIVSKSGSKGDSTILATEEKTSTTTIYPNSEKPRSFFNKLFGKKRDDADNSFKIVNEEKVKKDTIALSTDEQIAKNLEKSIRDIEKKQQEKNASFLSREAALANSNNLLVNQMLDILRKVESEVLSQIELNGVQAKQVVNTGINTISIIMLVFFLLTGLLLYLILTDITRSAKYRQALEVAKDEAVYHGKAKQRFLSNMSHEIRTPLQSIIGYAEIIKQQEHPDHKDIEAIYNSSEHLLQIVNEVLDYNRITSGKFSFSNTPFRISGLLDEVVAAMRPQATLKQLNMRTEFALNGIDFINGDPFRLKQILYNLLGNAIKFTNEGEIILSAFYKRQGDQLHFTFSVKDTGIGIAEEQSKLIFNEFEQVNSPEQEAVNRTGAGLGLSIIKSLVDNQGGRIYLKSKAGKGSTFTVYLTFTIAAEPVSEILQHAGKTLTTQKVWVIDDDQLILDLCAVIFSKNQIDYTCFSSPAQLLNTVWDDSVGYVLMDMRMPEMDGFELCRILRSRIPADVKIYAITAQVLPDEQENLLANGFDGLVMKPFRERELLAALYEEKQQPDHSYQAADLDLNGLRKMTYGDEKQLNSILLRFIEDCVNDSTELKKALAAGDTDTLCLLTHRLAGRIAQIGAKELAAEFRVKELELRKNGYSDVQLKDIRMLLDKLAVLTDKIKKQTESYYSIS
ncbi:ATP-binding protein [Pedobacter metabolipauper]|uniref:histidine kinase n=1 Tax=Pedobacter metabolipauper TaxID=425513 RepID=A0A4V3D1C3_9SPHI|nr:ATP-binding protein [Pedobacter metabolipauper]TDQ10137.1 signal transduction histidine kinase [Pedobacter metabolipauper]